MSNILRVFLLALLVMSANQPSSAAPPFSGTIFFEPNIITDTDPTAFVSLRATGRGMRQMYDRRSSSKVNVNAYIFVASYDDD